MTAYTKDANGFYTSWILCEHANECPSRCPCDDDCVCKAPGNMCDLAKYGSTRKVVPLPKPEPKPPARVISLEDKLRKSAHDLVLAFDSDHPEFARGFEAGQLQQALISGGSEAEFLCDEGRPFHTSNSQMILRIARATGYSVRFESTDHESWTWATFERVKR